MVNILPNESIQKKQNKTPQPLKSVTADFLENETLQKFKTQCSLMCIDFERIWTQYMVVKRSSLNYKGLQALIHLYWVEQLYNFKPMSSSVPIVALHVLRE